MRELQANGWGITCGKVLRLYEMASRRPTDRFVAEDGDGNAEDDVSAGEGSDVASDDDNTEVEKNLYSWTIQDC